jgi:hypothetical protein
MRATALIKALQQLVKEHGNLEVRIRAIRRGRLDHVNIDSITGRKVSSRSANVRMAPFTS